MKVGGKAMRTIWLEPDGWSVGVIDQTALPHRFATARLTTLDETAHAIRAMIIRGAPLIGATAAYGMCLALRADASDEAVERAYMALIATRPTAINLKWALDEMTAAVRNRPRAPSGRRFRGARVRGRGCCIRPRNRLACALPRASLSPLSAGGEREGKAGRGLPFDESRLGLAP